MTLELDENQTLIMLLAQEKGQIALTYNPTGAGTGGINVKTENDRITMEQLLGMTDEPAEKKPFKTEHYRGGGRSSSSYWRDGERIEYQGSGDSNDGSRLQSTGDSAGGFQTNADPANNNNLTQKQPAVSGTL